MASNLREEPISAVAKPPAELPLADKLVQLQQEHEWLLKQLRPVPCPVCGEGETFLAIDEAWLMQRVCNRCGSGLTSLEESRWNIKNKFRRLPTC